MEYSYQTNVGKFTIKPQSGRWLLSINDNTLGSYNSPHQAADDVYNHATNHNEWDEQLDIDDPTDLSEWKVLR